MIKECKVLKWNELVMVVDFDGNQIQMPSTDKNTGTVYIDLTEEIYSVVSKNEYEKSLMKSEKKHLKKEISDDNE